MPDSSPTDSVAKTKQYMDLLVPPDRERFEHITSPACRRSARRRARERRRSLSSPSSGGCGSEGGDSDGGGSEGGGPERDEAARVIQKTFRGYRARREMHGLSLDASSRWLAAIRDAQFRQSTKPRASTADDQPDDAPVPGLDDPVDRRPSSARRNWYKVSIVARLAGHDEDSSSSSGGDDDGSGSGRGSLPPRSPQQRAEDRLRRQQAKAARGQAALHLRLEYFLKLVDAKHRYGSNLRVYHDEWKRSDATDNFFWLDYGAGRRLDLDACPRDRLDREKVRYLSREERQYYLVRVDADGRLCWAKNGARIDTTQRFRDSVHGIVPADDPTPAFHPSSPPGSAASAASSSSSAAAAARETDLAAKYAGDAGFDGYDGARGVVKAAAHLSASTMFNKLLRKTVRPNTWIFVADTSFRLYVGIKDSGAFQHSSFLQGARISAAGLIKIKEGRLTSLSPLSGHYRPPASNFRAFVRSLRAAGVDMGRVSISKSYTVLVGLEAYVETRRRGRALVDCLRRKSDDAADKERRKHGGGSVVQRLKAMPMPMPKRAPGALGGGANAPNV